ncbi:glycosyltransferase [Bacillus sp. X1(2014)]|uniref:CgeB family protein n=1 Tax=Bacillus sp. X1(2014) TaxID=1565991 RepID=UPI00119F4A1C|nr:glycosyltransferase [Bacillus sp. X1(2014)]
MNILFISSGFLGIYPIFEDTIEKAFKTMNHSIAKITPMYTEETVELIESLDPDFVFAFVGYKVDYKLIQILKQRGTTLGVWLTEDPYYIDQSVNLIEQYDYIFTIDIGACEFYNIRFPNKKIYHLPLGTDPTLYYPANIPNHYLYDLCLIGYPYTNRIELIKHILDQTSYSLLLVGPNWSKFINYKNNHQLKIINKWIKPEFVRQIFSLSKIILNPHRSYNFHKNQNTLGIESKSINNRTFDIAACGGFQLIENKLDLTLHFDTSREIVPYNNFDECVHLINQFVMDENSRNFYSQNARERILTDHTFTHRIELLLKQINGNEK